MSNNKKNNDRADAKDVVTIDFVKSDPCFGCRYAVPKTKKEVERDGIFTRRFLCASIARLDTLERKVVHGMVKRDFDVASAALEEMRDAFYRHSGLLECEDIAVQPSCYVPWRREPEEDA